MMNGIKIRPFSKKGNPVFKKKKHTHLRKIGLILYFYGQQSLKAALILVAGWVPIDVLHNYIYMLEQNHKKLTDANSLAINVDIQLMTTVAAILFSFAVICVLIKINWRWSKSNLNPEHQKSREGESQ